MNIAAKAIQPSSLFQGQSIKLQCSRQLFLQIMLFFSILLSALSVIYVINLHRVTCDQLQRAEKTTHWLQLQWGQLLLEQASLVTPARVEQLAKTQLHMVFPAHDRIFILRAE